MRALLFLLVSLFRGRFTFALWELAETSEFRLRLHGDAETADSVRDLRVAAWARARLAAQGADLPALRKRLHSMLAVLDHARE